jgi:hypothetical protein
MNYIFIILDSLQPKVFTSSELGDYFIFHERKFFKNNEWVGGFYDFNVYRYNEVFYLGGIELNFILKDESIIYTLNNITYIEIFSIANNYLSLYLKLNDSNQKIEQLQDFSQWFGNDYLYKCEKSSEYCFVFELPDKIKIP